MNEEYDEENALATAEIEWENDRKGLHFLDAGLFQDGIFELADFWCHTVSGDEYSGFIWRLFGFVAEGTPPDAYEWRLDDEIVWGGYCEADIIEKPPLLGEKREQDDGEEEEAAKEEESTNVFAGARGLRRSKEEMEAAKAAKRAAEAEALAARAAAEAAKKAAREAEAASRAEAAKRAKEEAAARRAEREAAAKRAAEEKAERIAAEKAAAEEAKAAKARAAEEAKRAAEEKKRRDEEAARRAEEERAAAERAAAERAKAKAAEVERRRREEAAEAERDRLRRFQMGAGGGAELSPRDRSGGSCFTRPVSLSANTAAPAPIRVYDPTPPSAESRLVHRTGRPAAPLPTGSVTGAGTAAFRTFVPPPPILCDLVTSEGGGWYSEWQPPATSPRVGEVSSSAHLPSTAPPRPPLATTSAEGSSAIVGSFCAAPPPLNALGPMERPRLRLGPAEHMMGGHHVGGASLSVEMGSVGRRPLAAGRADANTDHPDANLRSPRRKRLPPAAAATVMGTAAALPTRVPTTAREARADSATLSLPPKATAISGMDAAEAEQHGQQQHEQQPRMLYEGVWHDEEGAQEQGSIPGVTRGHAAVGVQRFGEGSTLGSVALPSRAASKGTTMAALLRTRGKRISLESVWTARIADEISDEIARSMLPLPTAALTSSNRMWALRRKVDCALWPMPPSVLPGSSAEIGYRSLSFAARRAAVIGSRTARARLNDSAALGSLAPPLAYEPRRGGGSLRSGSLSARAKSNESVPRDRIEVRPQEMPLGSAGERLQTTEGEASSSSFQAEAHPTLTIPPHSLPALASMPPSPRSLASWRTLVRAEEEPGIGREMTRRRSQLKQQLTHQKQLAHK